MYGKIVIFICEVIKIEVWIPCTPETSKIELENIARQEILEAIQSNNLIVSFK